MQSLFGGKTSVRLYDLGSARKIHTYMYALRIREAVIKGGSHAPIDAKDGEEAKAPRQRQVCQGWPCLRILPFVSSGGRRQPWREQRRWI